MSTWLQATIIAHLLLVLQGSPTVVEITEKRVAAEGSSVLMHAPNVSNVNFMEWEYLRNATPEIILQCYADDHAATIYPPYQGRVTFYPENGSILLQNLRETDTGIYRATVNLVQDKTRTTLLEVIKPVSQPELQWSSNLAGSPIELVCAVPEGEVTSISWKKGGHPLPPEKCYLHSGNTTVLQIRKGEKSDCGSYSCNVSNAISWKETALNLTVTGLTPPLRHAQKLVVVTLIFTTVAAVSFIILLCQLRKHSFVKGGQKYVVVCTHKLLSISSLLLLVTTIIWMREEGLSAAYIFLGLFFLAAAIATAQMAAAALRCSGVKKGHQVTWNSITLTTLTVNFLFTILLLHNIQQLHERGCSEAVDLTMTCVLATAAVLAVLLILLFLLWCCESKQKAKMNTQSTTHSTQVTTLVME